VPLDIERNRTGKPSLVRRGVALAVIVAAGLLALHFVVGILTLVLTVVVVLAALGAVLWAANQLL
jgi:fatty acid desaturase